jgi:hypothetical protein
VQPGAEISSHPKISTNLAIAEPQATRAPRTERVTARGARKIDNLFCRTTRVGAVARAGPHGGQGNPLARAVGCPTENELNIYSDSPTQKSHTTMTNATTPNTYARTARRVPLATSHHHPGSQHHHLVPPYHTINEPDNLRPSRNRSTPTLEKYASNTRTALTDTRVCVVRHTATTTQHHHPVPPHHHPVPPHHRPMPPHEKETHRSPPAPASNHALPAGHSASRWHGLASRDARVHDTRVQLGGRARAFREATAHAAHARRARARHRGRGRGERAASSRTGSLQRVPTLRLSIHDAQEVPQMVDEIVGLQPGRSCDMPAVLRRALPRLWRARMAARRLHLQPQAAAMRRGGSHLRDGRPRTRPSVRRALAEPALYRRQSGHKGGAASRADCDTDSHAESMAAGFAQGRSDPSGLGRDPSPTPMRDECGAQPGRPGHARRSRRGGHGTA